MALRTVNIRFVISVNVKLRGELLCAWLFARARDVRVTKSLIYNDNESNLMISFLSFLSFLIETQRTFHHCFGQNMVPCSLPLR